MGSILLALVFVPAPLLPPHRVSEAVQSIFGVDWKGAYLISAFGLHAAFYGALGLMASLAVKRVDGRAPRLLQVVVVPLVIVAVSIGIRTLKLGHFPMLVNAALPIGACVLGAGLGVMALYRGWSSTVPASVLVACVALWALQGGASGELSRSTELHLKRLVTLKIASLSGDHAFAALVESAFAPMAQRSAAADEVLHNRAAILALGIAIGHERIAQYAGLDPDGDLVRTAATLRKGVTLRGREDWSRHYTLSAALAVLGNSFASDAAGLVKEQLDALAKGSGFSFGDLAADRAGVRLAAVATRSAILARALQERLGGGFKVDEFLPPVSDLPENLTVEQFRSAYGTVGSAPFRKMVAEIERRLDKCSGLSEQVAVAQ